MRWLTPDELEGTEEERRDAAELGVSVPRLRYDREHGGELAPAEQERQDAETLGWSVDWLRTVREFSRMNEEHQAAQPPPVPLPTSRLKRAMYWPAVAGYILLVLISFYLVIGGYTVEEKPWWRNGFWLFDLLFD